MGMSLGGNGADPGYSTVIDAAVNSGVVVVVAAGNSNSDACNFSPAFAANAITVGSTTSTDARSSFSNYGSCVQIWAPGSSIVSASVSSDPSRSPAKVLQDMYNNGIENIISGLRNGDTNS